MTRTKQVIFVGYHGLSSILPGHTRDPDTFDIGDIMTPLFVGSVAIHDHTSMINPFLTLFWRLEIMNSLVDR